MYLLYSLVLTLLFLALLPYFVYQAARHGKYAGSLMERLGWLPESVGSAGKRTIWVHAVSVGEFLAARTLIERLKKELSNTRIVVSTTTLTGQRLARSQAAILDSVFYFPFDWKFTVRRSLAKVNPSAVIILETEIWPNFLRECNRRGITTVLANGRISDRSYRRYRMIGGPLRYTFGNFSLMLMQSEADAQRVRRLGAPSTRVHVCGNLKYDFEPAENSITQLSECGTRTATLGTSDSNVDRAESFENSDSSSGSTPYPLIIAGSTAPGEEEVLLAALREVRTCVGLENTSLVLAPRHPERFDEVARIIQRSQFKFVRRSEHGVNTCSSGSSASSSVSPHIAELSAEERSSDVLLLDTIGELASLYRLASVVFVGGSLVPGGGHNIIEPAAFAKPIIVGPHTENFRQIISDFIKEHAVIQIQSCNALSRELKRLLSSPEQADAMGGRARNILIANRGAAERTVAKIIHLIENQQQNRTRQTQL